MPRWHGDNNAKWWRILRQQAQNSSTMRGGSNREEKVLYKLLPRWTEGFDSQSILHCSWSNQSFPDQLFSGLFHVSFNVCLPQLLCATGYWCTFMVSTWYEFRIFSSLTDSQNPVNSSSLDSPPIQSSTSEFCTWLLFSLLPSEVCKVPELISFSPKSLYYIIIKICFPYHCSNGNQTTTRTFPVHLTG